ncbi:MAG: SGNH/GDSL hydrolase family protein [Lachnospiraceae bacterium]
MADIGKFLKRNWQSILVLLFATILTVTILNQSIPRAKPLLKAVQATKEVVTMEQLNIVALGDSLTQGVGDTTNSGGYVPILANALSGILPSQFVQTRNYGKSGNRVPQLIKRIEKTEEIQTDLKAADIITLTIGANDLMRVVKTNLFSGLTVETFDTPMAEYVVDLGELFKLIRSYNEEAPIYLLGIYNPFYLKFPEITELQDIVNKWNQATEHYVATQERIYFLPINDQLYMGNGLEGENATINNLLSEDDSFHPNYIGYQIIAEVFGAKILETVDEWNK